MVLDFEPVNEPKFPETVFWGGFGEFRSRMVLDSETRFEPQFLGTFSSSQFVSCVFPKGKAGAAHVSACRIGNTLKKCEEAKTRTAIQTHWIR